MRVVQGLPVSWDPVVVTASAKHLRGTYVWSPCDRFIAVPKDGGVQILDAVTLGQVNTLNNPDSSRGGWLSFSPNGHFLTHFDRGKVTSWDVQTGGPVCTTLSEPPSSADPISSTYSMDGKTFAILYESDSHGVITIYNLLCGTYTNSHFVLDGHIITQIWTHGECFRFTVVKSGSVTIWEAAFTLINTPTEVETLPVPDEIASANKYLFLPTLYRLAFMLQGVIVIWDSKTSKFLLNSGCISPYPLIFSIRFLEAVFSSDGHFFICLTNNREVYVWKESLTCYVLHQKLTISGNEICPTPFISSSGRSVIVEIGSIIHLWHTEDQIPFSTHARRLLPSILGFSPQNELAAFAYDGENTVIIIHLQSGNPQLIIDTDIDVKHLELTGSTIVIAGKKKVATYNLPAGNSTSNTRVGVGDNVQAITLENPSTVLLISPALNYIACRSKVWGHGQLEIYELSTGKCIVDDTPPIYVHRAWFTPDGHTVWVEHGGDQPSGRKIIRDSESGVTKLEPIEQNVSLPTGPPWESSTCGYQIVDDIWVLSPTQKRLLWLPPHWRTDEDCRVWNGNFLGLRHAKPREPVILEFHE